MACYSATLYAHDRKLAIVEVRCRQHASITSLQYQFGSQPFQASNSYQVDSSFATELVIKVQGTDAAGKTWTITLEALNFIWQGAAINQSPVYKGGQKGAVVEMFGWPYEDIKQECPYLAKMGWMGVRIFPPQESVFSYEWPQNGELNPWWFYYQPVSYKMNSRHGTRAQLREMIQTCRSAGLRVYADAVVNHMSGNGNDVWPSHRNGNNGWCSYWGGKSSTGSSPFFTHGFMWQNSNNTGLRPGMEFPAVPYNPTDFHCERSLSSWGDPFILNHGWLSGLADLNTEKDYVRERIAAYFTDLISIGFSGFRMDAAKHIYPKSIAAILAKFKRNLGGGDLPDDFFTWLEVLLGGEKDLLMCQPGEYNFGPSFTQFLADAGLSQNDIYRIKLWSSDYPKEFPICGNWVVPPERQVVQNDCHDDQTPGSSSRDMGDKGSVLVIQKDVNKHRDFEVQLFSRNDANWQIKMVLSSYSFKNGNNIQSIPDGKSDCAKCVGSACNSCTKSMPYSPAFDANSSGYFNGGWVEGAYTRVHRDAQIVNAMRKWQGLSTLTAEHAHNLGLPPTGYPESSEFLTE